MGLEYLLIYMHHKSQANVSKYIVRPMAPWWGLYDSPSFGQIMSDSSAAFS